jgi:dihydrofolate synthase/folylpolyglutamate synthase
MGQVNTDQILARLMTLHPKSIDLVLHRVERLLAALDHPERHLPPVIHVAGTNGKGSTVAFLRAMLEAAGYAVHVYTSPHLVTFNERIRVAGTLISNDDLNALLNECEAANGGLPITFFEITTVAAFLAFARTPADVVILETGLGGRLDATNVIKKPRLTCITPVSLDHQHFLGEDIASIMGEKAGILKSGVPCLSAHQPDPIAEAVLIEQAKSVGAPLKFITATAPSPRLPGLHQQFNAGLAAACAKALAPDFVVCDAAIQHGLKTVEWPGRLQHITSGPLAELLSDGWELWLDGGHNQSAAEVLAEHFQSWADQDLWLVFGALNQRDPAAFLGPLAPYIQGLQAVTIP